MKLSIILKSWFSSTNTDCDITGVQHDSRQIKSGDLFLAYPGAVADGRLFIQQAINAGAVAIAYEPSQFPANVILPSSLTCIPITDLAQKIAVIASNFYGDPTQNLDIIGVTGTNGKTTIAYQLAQAHDLLKTSSIYLGTLGHGPVNTLQPLNNTTPDALCLQHLCYEYKQQGVKQVSMEVSSHALNQRRVDNINFTQAIYTNLTHDHLDYHHTMQAYAAAKAMLFAMPTLQWAIINNDDPYASVMLEASTSKILTYGLQENCDVQALNYQITMTGSTFDVRTPWGNATIRVQTLGLFNIYNSLAVLTSLLAHGYALSDVVDVMAKLHASPGRMEVVSHAPCVIVDYAHTPDALENVLKTLTQLKTARLWVVFGCGGDRDRLKRPMMGRIASQYADGIVLTSDNPRSEDPKQIIDDIAAGLSSASHVIQCIDRKEAIEQVFSLADKQDMILIAGKGHEAYQQIGQERFEFSDQAIVKALNYKIYC